MQQQFQQSRATLRRALLAGTAFSGTFAAVIAGDPGSALAACTVTALPNSVTCDTTATILTTNVDGASTTSNAYTQLFNLRGAVGTVNAGQTISGNGLWITTTQSGAPITFSNNGAVTGAGNGLTLNSSGGDIAYSGNGSASSTSGFGLSIDTTIAGGSGAIAVGTSGAPVTASFSGVTALRTQAGTSAIDVFLNGGSLTTTDGNGTGLLLNSSGNVSATLTGNTTIANASGSPGAAGNAFAIVAFGSGINVTSNANIGTAGAAFNYGIFANGGGAGIGSVSVSQTGGTIFAATVGIDASILNRTNASDLTVVVNGNIVSNIDGVSAGTLGTGNAHISVGAGATVQGTTEAGLLLAGGSGGANTVTNNGAISGATGLETRTGRFTVTNAGSITGTGGTAVTLGGANNLFIMSGPAAALTGQAVGSGTDTFQFAGSGSNSFDASQIGAGWTLLDKTGSSNWTLTGTSTYAGPVTVDGGTLSVNGNLASAASLTVNSGGTLGGTGTVGSTLINGGTLSPGNSIGTLTVSGSLTLTAASTYLVQVSGSSADKTVVTGAAALAGKVVVDPLVRLAATTTYTIVTAGAVSGRFSSVDFLTASSFARNARLSYVGNDVLLTLDPGLLSPSLPGNANINQRNVAAGIDNALTGGGTLPAGFNALFALSGAPLLSALTQASGETATGTQQTTFDAMNLFMGVLTDPFVAGRGDPVTSPGGGATGYAADDSDTLAYAGARRRSGAERDAYAAVYRKAPPAQVDAPRWSVWAAGFGGSRTTDGNGALGSNAATSRIAGGTAGADYWFSPSTVAGFALAGGGTSFSVANGGTGRSDLFQAGAFVRHNSGPAYVTGALAYGWQDVTTDRTVTVAGADHLQARFNANAYSGRLEGGYRFVAPWAGNVGLTPYVAGQFTRFDLPAYAEQAITGSNLFALSYASKSVTATRSELGVRGDRSFALNEAILTLRGRAAWAHDFNADRNVAATFQALPGASFVVNGAAQAHDAALTTASAEMTWRNGWSAAATFEGEFSSVTRSYAGKGVARYQW
ncbi:autotransporter outer membrane beta-barrel domain-containing protein [Bradyrhizobium sp. B120]|uniref:autotransporter outer membrane beta-barrel domain-containing protein n=1 Tax=Bradyrhizobium sp. B120 TaxID=3410088 RepID=UPI003B98576B